MQQFSQRHGALVSRSMPTIAKMVASSLGVKVFFDAGHTPYANAQGIHLPVRMKAVGNAEDATLMNGFLDHEAAHIRYSDFNVITKCRSQLEKTILNIIEDIRIEDLIGRVFPGCKKNLADTAKILDGEVKPDSSASPSSLICGFLSTNLRANILGHSITGASDFRAAVTPILGEKLIKQIESLAILGCSAEDTDKCYDFVRKIMDLLKSASQDQSQQQQQQQSGQGKQGQSGKSSQNQSKEKSKDQESEQSKSDQDSEGQSSGSGSEDSKSDEGSGSGSDDSKSDEKSKGQGSASDSKDSKSDEKSDSQGSGNSSDESQSDDGSEGQGSGSGSDESKSDEGSGSGSQSASEGAQGSQGQESSSGSGKGQSQDSKSSQDSQGNGSSGAGYDPNAIAKALKETGTDVFAEALKQAIESMTSNHSPVEPERINLGPKNRSNPGRFSTQEADSGVRKVAGRFDLMLWSKSDCMPYATSSGKIRSHRLASVITHCNTKIFDRVDEDDGLDTAVSVMFDVSGSMSRYDVGTNRYGATQTAAIIAGVCERYDGINCSVAAFDDVIIPVKDFDEKWPRVGKRIEHIGGMGGTAMGAAHSWAVGEICQREERRRIIIVATDGLPRSLPALEASVAEAARYDIETRFVLIGKVAVDSFKSSVPSATCVTSAATPDAIPNAILEALKGGKGIA